MPKPRTERSIAMLITSTLNDMNDVADRRVFIVNLQRLLERLHAHTEACAEWLASRDTTHPLRRDARDIS
jgi:hypothetical protein